MKIIDTKTQLEEFFDERIWKQDHRERRTGSRIEQNYGP